MQLHISSGGHQEGPYTLEEVNDRISRGAIVPARVLAWHQGISGWVPLAEIPGINVTPDSLNSSAAAPPPLPPPRPMGVHTNAHAAQGDDTASIIVPYRNPPALAAYYMGLFSLVPALGIILTFPAIILGYMGLRKRAEEPLAHGTAHAWAGIIMGAFSLLAHLAIIGWIIYAMNQ